MLIERAVEVVLEHMPLPSDEVVARATLLAAETMAARGYTEVCDAGIMHFPGLVAMNSPMQRWLDIMRDVDTRNPLPIGVNVMIPAPSSAAERVLSGSAPRQLSQQVRYTHLKLYCDGAFGSRGALLHEPYADDGGNLGISRMTGPEMLDYSRRALAVGLDVAIHAIGDAAVTRVLDVYEKILGDDGSLAPRRLRLEHFSVATSRDIERAARMGILVVAQPGFVWPFTDGSCMEDLRLGPERVTRAYVWRTLLNRGAQLVGSSDDYGLPPHPLWNYFAAVHRQNPEGIPEPGWQPQERLEPVDALRMFTRTAFPGGELTSGQLTTGAAADLAVLSHNPLALPAGKLPEVTVFGTMRKGRWTHRAGI
jgi:predicted amidohydrolase YtcJ